MPVGQAGLVAGENSNMLIVSCNTDVKANNVMIDYEDTPDGIVVTRTQLTDIEDGAHAEPDEVLVGSPVGNYMWRSPEAHIGGPIQTPVDMFSFALLVSPNSCQLVVSKGC